MYQVTRCRCRARPLYPSRRGRDFFWVLTGHFLWTLSTCFIGTVHFKSFYHSTHIIYRVHIQYIHIYIYHTSIIDWYFNPVFFVAYPICFLINTDHHRPSTTFSRRPSSANVGKTPRADGRRGRRWSHGYVRFMLYLYYIWLVFDGLCHIYTYSYVCHILYMVLTISAQLNLIRSIWRWPEAGWEKTAVDQWNQWNVSFTSLWKMDPMRWRIMIYLPSGKLT